jgi:hypothetical protein
LGKRLVRPADLYLDGFDGQSLFVCCSWPRNCRHAQDM